MPPKSNWLGGRVDWHATPEQYGVVEDSNDIVLVVGESSGAGGYTSSACGHAALVGSPD